MDLLIARGPGSGENSERMNLSTGMASFGRGKVLQSNLTSPAGLRRPHAAPGDPGSFAHDRLAQFQLESYAKIGSYFSGLPSVVLPIERLLG
jgi:hypothetical protein